jgi:hypothetical protein
MLILVVNILRLILPNCFDDRVVFSYQLILVSATLTAFGLYIIRLGIGTRPYSYPPPTRVFINDYSPSCCSTSVVGIMSERQVTPTSLDITEHGDSTTNPTQSRSLRPPKNTPRNPEIAESHTDAPRETPYEALRQLAAILPKPSTPRRRASSAGPPSTRKPAVRTPGPQARTPGAAQRYGRPGPSTPHGRAALREIELRRAVFTPGRDRRRSGLQQRETPRDLLRQLSRILAPGTKPTIATPPPQLSSARRVTLPPEDDIEEDQDLPLPKLSMPLGDDDDDSLLLQPPQSAGLEEEQTTQYSIELPRRAVSEQPGGRYSYGSTRASERFGDLTEVGLEALSEGDIDSSFIPQGNFDDDEADDHTYGINIPRY